MFFSFSKDKTLTTILPTPARENSLRTGKAEGKPPFSVCLWAWHAMWYLKSNCFFTNCSPWHNRPMLPVSTSPFPSCQMALLTSGTWHSCESASPGWSHVLSPSPVPRDGKGSPAAADPPGSHTQLTGAEFVPIPHLPTTVVKISPWVFIMLKPEGSENPFFPARAELSMNRTRVWGDAARYSKRKVYFCKGGIPLEMLRNSTWRNGLL